MKDVRSFSTLSKKSGSFKPGKPRMILSRVDHFIHIQFRLKEHGKKGSRILLFDHSKSKILGYSCWPNCWITFPLDLHRGRL